MAFSTHDIVPDSPTNNFATLNVLENPWFTHSNGNLATVRNGTSSGSWRACSSSIAVESDIWYYELLISDSEIMAGVFSEDVNIFAANQPQDSQNSLGMVLYEGQSGSSSRIRIDSTFPSNISEKAAANTIIGFLVDFINTTFKVYFNGTLKHTASFNSSVIVGKKNKIVIVSYSGTSNGSFYLNFGQDHTFGGYPNSLASSSGYPDSKGYGLFYYDPTQIASDVKALCTANLPDFTPTVGADAPQDYFKAVIWTNATTDTNVTVNLPFQADMIWWKQRDQGNSHRLIDSVRGLTSELTTNSTTQESIIDPATRDYNVTSINSDNFTFNGYVNTSTRGGSMVAWCWKAGGAPSGSTSTTGSAKRINTSGTQDDTSCSALATAATNAGASNVITPTLMSINQAAGFSIVKYTGNNTSGATIPHGLTQKPDLIIHKNLSGSYAWVTYHRYAATGGANNNGSWYLSLNGTAAASSGSTLWPSEPNSNVVTVANNDEHNGASSNNYIMYCWHSVEGYSKFGSYTGNGSTDGPMVYCGFRPAFVMLKQSSVSGEGWTIHDNARGTYNENDYALYPNLSSQESSGTNVGIDFLSNGFKHRETATNYNQASTTYIFMAFAEQPFKYSNAR